MSLEDFEPADGSADDLDEDLFDFPSLESQQGDSVARSKPEEAPKSSSDQQVPVELDEPAAPLPAVDPLEDDEPSGIDMSLDDDEDIFGFPPVESMNFQGEVRPSLDQREFEGDDHAGAPPREIREEDLDSIIREAKAEQRRKTAAQKPVLQEPETPKAVDLEELDSLTPVAPPEDAPAPVAAATSVVGFSIPPKALWIFTSASVLFMLGLLLIAWNFNSAFQRQLEATRITEVDAAKQVQPIIEPQVTTEQAPVPTEQGTRVAPFGLKRGSRSDQVLGLQEPHDSILVVAKSAIADGRFVEARRLLFSMLAEIDRVPADKRQSTEQQAAFLIANSHKTEAEFLHGGTE